MDSVTRILIFARPGHFRSSLIALLKTLPRTELFPVDDPLHFDQDALLQAPFPLILADLDGLGPAGLEAMDALLKRWPSTRCLALVDHVYQPGAVAAVAGGYPSLGADCVLAKSVSAGEFLRAVQQLSSGRDRSVSPLLVKQAWALG